MLVDVNHVLRYVGGKQCCIGASDTPNLEILMAVIRATEEREEPAIVQHAQLHEYETPIHIVGPIMVRIAKETRVPVCAALDRSEDLDYVKKALDLGSSAVVYDGSSLTHEENVAMTGRVAAIAKTCNVDVEAEIGTITGHEGKISTINGVSGAYTDPELTARYVRGTGIDTLTASVGTVHGFYATKPKLDFNRIMKIKELTGFPLIICGGSGIGVADIQRAIRCGICKINYFSYMSNMGVKAVKKLLEKKGAEYFHDLVDAAVDVMEQGVLNAMSIFALEQA